MRERIRILFAPDWRAGVPYQRLLAHALASHGVDVSFLSDYRRLLPLTRLLRRERRENPFDLLHLHWPEAYYPRRGDLFDPFRAARFPLDLALAARHCPLAVTAHNLAPHNRTGEPPAVRNSLRTFRKATVTFAHSEPAARVLVQTCGVKRDSICVIPHGDLSVAMPKPVSPSDARSQLGLGQEAICLMFGTVEPYKGIEEIINHWRRTDPPATLLIAGEPMSASYEAKILEAAAGFPRVRLHLTRLTDEELALMLSAAHCALFNYRKIFTSGAASLARSWGVPLLIPQRLASVDLGEPNPRVFRFTDLASDFNSKLDQALATPSDFASASRWRTHCRWEEVARLTSEAYRKVLDDISDGLPDTEAS
jgi:glycosyltransferase involved in cell wall biosynthesis